MGMKEDILVRLGLDASQLTAGMETGIQKVRSFSEGVGKLGLGGVASIALVGAAFKSVMDYAKGLDASVTGFAGATRDLAKGWDEVKGVALSAGASIIGFATALPRAIGEGIGDLVNWARYGKEAAEANKAIAESAEANFQRIKEIEPLNQKIAESLKAQAAEEAKLVPIAEQRANAARAVMDLQAQYDNAEGDIVDKKKIQVQLEEAKTALAKITTSETLAQRAATEAATAADKQAAEAKLQSLTHQERINYYQNQIAESAARAASVSSSEAEKGKAVLEVKKAQAALEKENAEWQAKAALQGRELVEYSLLLRKSAQGLTEEERARLDILNLIIKLKQNERTVNEILSDGKVTKAEAEVLAAIEKQNTAIQKQITLKQGSIDAIKAQLVGEGMVTEELQKQNALKAQQAGMPTAGNPVVGPDGKTSFATLDEAKAAVNNISESMMQILGGFKTYYDELDQKRYESQLVEGAKKDIQAEIDMWERRLKVYRDSNSSLAKYEADAINDRIEALRKRQSHVEDYVFDPNYKDQVGQGLFAQQVTKIGDPLGLQGEKQTGKLTNIEQLLADMNERLRIAGLPKS